MQPELPAESVEARNARRETTAYFLPHDRTPSSFQDDCRSIGKIISKAGDLRELVCDGCSDINILRPRNIPGLDVNYSALSKFLGLPANGDILFCEAAQPHVDWDEHFFSLVVATSLMVKPDSGYQLSLKKPEATQCLVESFDLNTHQGPPHFQQLLQPGTFFHFNAGDIIHWADTTRPRKERMLILLQWMMTGAEAAEARARVSQALAADWVEASL